MRRLERFRPTSLTPMQERGPRTAGYLVAGLVATIPLWLLAFLFTGYQGAWAVIVVGWATGVVWLLKKRQDDPEWDSR
jgi:hypothetical protein